MTKKNSTSNVSDRILNAVMAIRVADKSVDEYNVVLTKHKKHVVKLIISGLKP